MESNNNLDKPKWKKPEFEPVKIGTGPECNPAFPQVLQCEALQEPQSGVGCTPKDGVIFS